MTGDQCRAARSLLGITQLELASRAEIAEESIIAFEKGRKTLSGRVFRKLRAALLREGIELLDDERGIGVRRKLKASEFDRLIKPIDMIPFEATKPDTISAAECRGARSLLGWSREEASQRAGVNRHVMSGFDSGIRCPVPSNRTRIKKAFVDGGVLFERAGQKSRLTIHDESRPEEQRKSLT